MSDQLNQGNPFIVSAIRSWPCLSTKSRGVASFNSGARLHMSPAVSPLVFYYFIIFGSSASPFTCL